MAESLRDLNILFDPLSELLTVLHSNAFGITSFAIDEAHSFPRSETDKAAVLEQSKQTRHGVEGVCGRARVILLDHLPTSSAGLSSAQPRETDAELTRVEVGVLLDHRGFTVEHTSAPSSSHHGTTYETLETLLIAVSPKYVEAMTLEVSKRFEEPYKPRWQHDDE